MNCPFCRHASDSTAPFCPRCGALIPTPKQDGDGDGGGWHNVPLQDAFTPEPPLRPPRRFPVAAMLLLACITATVFGVVAILRNLDTLPREFPDQQRFRDVAWKLLVPFFNLFWAYLAWLELSDRLERELARRGHPRRLPRRLLTATFLLLPVPFLDLAALLLIPILAAWFQNAVNQLADITPTSPPQPART